MKMRTRILGRMLNSEVQQYLERNDIIIVPVGTTEMHGGMPLDCETVVSEAIGLKMAEACDALLLTGLPYFYAGATASGRGTVQVSVRQGIDYLGAIARSLLRQGFKRQIYISFHGPAHMTICPMLRDFYDETGVPILYMDMCMQLFNKSVDLFMMDKIQTDPVGVMKRMDASTSAIPDEKTRLEMADMGQEIIEALVQRMNVPHVVEQMKDLAQYNLETEARYPWMPSAWNKAQGK